MSVKVTEAILDTVERCDAWQNWISSGMSPQTLESQNPTPHSIFMRFDPELSKTYPCAREITEVWWMNMGGGIPAGVLNEFERIVDELGVVGDPSP